MNNSIIHARIESLIKGDIQYRTVDNCGTCDYFEINKVTSSKHQLPNHCRMFSFKQKDDIQFLFSVSPKSCVCNYHRLPKKTPGLKFPLRVRGVDNGNQKN